MLLRNLYYCVVLCCMVCFGQAQTNNLCANATPFCTGQTMQFPASTNAGQAQAGPFYDCLFSQPNPAWFFFQIQSGGTMSLAMSANNDIDFCCWGPFPTLSGACNNLTAGNVQDCSYSGSPTETCTIANAIPGMFYLMLITNFSNSQQQITFNQNNANLPGAASTDCSFVCLVTATNSGIICAGGNVTISATTSSAVSSFTWLGPGSYSSGQLTNYLGNLQSGGVYTLVGTANATINNTPYTSTCAAQTTVQVVQYPGYTITPTFTNICNGTNFIATVTFTTPSNPANFNYSWAPATGAGLAQPNMQSTLITPNVLPVSQTVSSVFYTVTVTPINTLISCPITETLNVVIYNPTSPTLNLPPPICDTYNPLQLTANPGGGSWTGNPAVNAAGIFQPSLAGIGPNLVQYVVSVAGCSVSNTGTFEVSKFHTAALSSSVTTLCVQDPLFDLMNIVMDTTTGSWSGTNVNAGNMFNPANLPTGNYSLNYNSPSFPNPRTCPSSTTLVMPVFNPPAPVISNIPPLCNIAATVQLTASPGGGTWTGNPAVSLTGVQIPSVALIGLNTVTYTAGQNTCVASSSRTFHISQFIPATITGTLNPQCVNSPPFNLLTIVQNTSGTWSGAGVNASNIYNPAGLATNIYTLTYFSPSSPNAALCPDTRYMSVSVLNPATPTITQVGPLCTKGAAVQLSVSPNTGYWITTSYLDANGIFTPSLSSVGNNVVQYVVGTNTCNTQQAIQISTENFVPATIVATLPNLCNNVPPVNLAPYTANNLGAWSGPGIAGNTFNPAVIGSGDFKLVYNTASVPSGLCPDSDTLAVKVFSLDIPVIAQAGPYCNNAKPFQLQVTPLGGLFGGHQALNAAGVFNPALAVLGNNVISYSITSGPCKAFAQSTVEIEEFVSAALLKQPAAAYCVNQEPFNLFGLVQNNKGTWSGPGVTPTFMFDPEKANIGSNNILTYHTQSSPHGLLCPDVSTVQIKVKEQPNPGVTSTSLTGCIPLTVAFSSTETPEGVGSWNFGDGSKDAQGFKTSHVYNRSGKYDVIYNYQDNEAPGCSTQVKLSSQVNVLDQPNADFSVYPEEVTVSDQQVILTNLSSPINDNQYMWTITGFDQSFTIHKVVNFPVAGLYRVTLQATSWDGCKSEVIRFIEVANELNVYVPNSFTPNHDGLNDQFRPVFALNAMDRSGYLLEIYDRWGKIIFSTKDPVEGWDGTFQNGGDPILKQDAYNYELTYRDLDGRVYNKNGTVTLLR